MALLLNLLRTACIFVAIASIPFTSCLDDNDDVAEISSSTRQHVAAPRRLRGGKKNELSMLASEMNVTGRIINGEVVGSAERFPYFVALLDSRYAHVCGGSLIGPDTVLTAAHCE